MWHHRSGWIDNRYRDHHWRPWKAVQTSNHSNFKVASVCHLVVILELWNMQYHANSISPALLHTVWSLRENIEMWICCFNTLLGATLHFTESGNELKLNKTVFVRTVPVQGYLWFIASLIFASIVLDLEPDHIYVWISTHFESKYCLKVETWGRMLYQCIIVLLKGPSKGS